MLKKITVGVINVTIHPHTKELYIKLLKQAQIVGAVPIRASDAGMLCHVSEKNERVKSKSIKLVTGEIYKFTNIEIDGEWFHMTKEAMADEKELQHIEIPDEMKPNASKFSFCFYPEKHLLFYEGYYKGKNFSPYIALRFFENLFNSKQIKGEFGQVEVTHIPDSQKVNEIIGAKHKKLLKLKFTRPNPDSLSEAERKFLRTMNDRNVAKIEQEYKSIEGQDIEMDQELTQLSRIAARNGELLTKIVDHDGHPAELSTKSYPLIIKEYFDSDKTIQEYKFKLVVNSLISTVSKWLK